MVKKRKTPQVMVAGVKYKISPVADSDNACRGCAADLNTALCFALPDCWLTNQTDVIYVKIKRRPK